MDKIFGFAMDFPAFYDIIIANEYKIYNEIMRLLNDILLHFVASDKWWQLSHIMCVLNDLFANDKILKQYTNDLKNKSEIALNIKYGIYSFLIWIAYMHQITPKPIICFFENDFEINAALNMDSDLRKQKLFANATKTNNNNKMFETLPTIQQRITELCLSESALIKLLTTMDSCLVTDIVQNFVHIRDKFVIIKLLMLLLHNIDFLIENNVLEFDENYKCKFLKIVNQFKHGISKTKAVQSLPKTKCGMKSKIVFKKIRINKKRKRIKNNNNNNSANIIEKKVSQSNDALIFKHFTVQSMKIVECIINNKKDLLYQFVTGNKSPKSRSRSPKVKMNINKQKRKIENISMDCNIENTPNNNCGNVANKDMNIDISLLSSTLSCIQSALDTPKMNRTNTNVRREREDFDFDFQTISNHSRVAQSQQTYLSGFNNSFRSYDEPPIKKRRVNIGNECAQNNNNTVVNNAQLSNLLAYLCEDKGNDKSTIK